MEREYIILERFGLEPKHKYLQEIRTLLIEETNSDNYQEHEYLKTLCIMLFSFGCVEDSLLIWNAKMKDFDAGCYIDGELLMGAGLDETINYLTGVNTIRAKELIKYLQGFTSDGDYMKRSEVIEFYRRYYKLT
ncbi:hypothetical protein [Paenibacillus harenae]|uniref:Uncharacterized protein n=1 Tax=Paenibacillus harenae TaxID=306543 RepID=A0ABT9TYH3_PAEHA|nr:hypothetical protein [Paenibacillus harenae]MDQ0112426.1 hypothetical protein [Paenibacillus harenae]